MLATNLPYLYETKVEWRVAEGMQLLPVLIHIRAPAHLLIDSTPNQKLEGRAAHRGEEAQTDRSALTPRKRGVHAANV